MSADVKPPKVEEEDEEDEEDEAEETMSSTSTSMSTLVDAVGSGRPFRASRPASIKVLVEETAAINLLSSLRQSLNRNDYDFHASPDTSTNARSQQKQHTRNQMSISEVDSTFSTSNPSVLAPTF